MTEENLNEIEATEEETEATEETPATGETEETPIAPAPETTPEVNEVYELIDVISWNGKKGKVRVDWTNVKDRPAIPSDKSAEIAELQARCQALEEEVEAEKAKSEFLEDFMSLDLYSDYPHITFSASTELTNVRITKGNEPDSKIMPLFGRNIVVAYNKDGNGYDKGDEVDAKGSASTAQFNMLVDVPEGKVAVIQAEPTTAYNKAEAVKEGEEGNTFRLKLTKVVANATVTALATVPVAVSYINNTDFTLEDNNKGAAPTNANDLADLIFKVVHNSNNAEHADIPVTVKIGEGEALALTSTDKGKNKDQFTIDKALITADILITVGNTPVPPEPGPEETDGTADESTDA